jgi:cell division protein FtsZ
MSNETTSVAVLGLGHGGSRVAAGVYEAFPRDGFRIVVADTDQRALGSLGLPNSIVLGADWARGQGCGGDVKRGERAAAGCRKELEDTFGSDLTVVVVGLGGGAGSGAAAVVARLAREAGAPVVFLVTLPIALEGRARRLQAEESLRELRETVDTVVAVDSDNLFSTLSPDTLAPMAFATANRVLAETVAIWGRLFLAQPLIPVDLAAMRALLSAGPMQCHVGVAMGEDGMTLGGAQNLAEAESALVGVVGGPGLSMGLLSDLMGRLDRCFSPNARLVKGGGILPDAPAAESQVQVIVVTCRRETPSEGPRQLELFSDAPVVSRGKRMNMAGGSRQKANGIVEPSLGVFAGSDPTKVGQENLDVPTFQRKGVSIDLGVTEP